MPSRPAASIDGPRWERRPDDRPRALMASALKLLIRRGYRRIRVQDVARDAGVSKATIYHYFANKDDLLTQTIAGRIADKQAEIEARMASAGGSASARLRLFLQQFWLMSLTKQAGLWQQMLVSEILTEAPEVFAVWARGLAERWRSIEALIKEGQRSGEFRRDADAAVAARMIVSALSHQALFHVHFGMRRFAPCDVNRLFDSALEQLLHGLRAPVSRASRR
jgi:AcrR family transcriptional regulator